MSTLKPLTIFMVSMSGHFDWDAGMVNRNYFVLRELLRRDDVGTVVTLDFPPFSRKMMIKEAVKSQMFNPFLRNVVFRTPFSYVRKRSLNGKTYYHYASLLPHISPQRFLSETKKVFEKLSVQNPILWSYDPLSYPIMKQLSFSATVFDTVDDWTLHSSFTNKRATIEKNYALIGKTADCIFTVAESLTKRFPDATRVHWIPNAVDSLLIQEILTSLVPQELATFQHPLIGYMGIIQSRVDLSLVEAVAKRNPDKTFLLIGPTWPVFLSKIRPKTTELKRFRAIPNVRFLGRLPFAQGLKMIRHCDAVMIPHVRDHLTQSMNPMKLYEALALGKPVISTSVAGLDRFRDHVEVADTPEDFSEKISLALKIDSEEKQQARKLAVAEFSWEKAVSQMVEKLLC